MRTPKGAQARPQSTSVVKSESPAATELIRGAVDFERRGVLDRAARAWREVFEVDRNAQRLLSAAELYERALALPAAAECYEQVKPFAEFEQRASAGLSRIAAIGVETYFDRETSPALLALIEQARQYIARGELDKARELLTSTEEARIDRDALTLLGSIHWRRGERVLAQNAWAQARGVSRLLLIGATVNAIPAFNYAPVDLAFHGDALWLATADGTLLEYDPRLRAFTWLGDRASKLEQLGPLGDAAELWSMPSIQSQQEMLEDKVVAVASRDGRRVVWVAPQQVSYFAPNRIERLEAAWAFGSDADARKATAASSAPSLGLDLAGLRGERTTFTSASFSPGEAATERVYVGSSDGTVRALSSSGKELFSWSAHTRAVTELAVSNDGKFLASAGKDSKARVWDTAERKQRAVFELEGEARALHFFPNDDTLEITGPWNLVRYDWRSGTERARVPGGVEFLRVVHAASRRWTAVGHYKTTSVDVYEGSSTERYAVTTSQVLQANAALSSDQRLLALAAPSGVFAVELEPFAVRRVSDAYASQVAVSPNGRSIAALHENDVRVYNRDDGALVSTVALGSFRPEQLQFQSDTELALSARSTTRSIELNGGKSLRAAENAVHYPLVDGELVLHAAGLQRTSLRGHVLETLDHVKAPIAVNAARTHFAYQREGNLVVRAAGSQSEAQIAFNASIEHLALSRDGSRVALCIYPNRLFVFDVAHGTGREILPAMHGGLGGISSLAFYGNEWILVSGTDGVIAVDGRDDTVRGGLHLLSNGRWFSIVNRSYSTFTDGDESAIDATAGFPSASPGLYWEGLRNPASFAQLLAGKLPADE